MVGQGQAKVLEEAFKQMGPIDGRTVQVITEDAQGEAASAVDAARKLVENDHVVAIFGPTEIGQKMAVANYIKSVGIPRAHLQPVAGDGLPGQQVARRHRRVDGPGPAASWATTSTGRRGGQTMNTLTEDNSAGRAFFDPLTKVFTTEGGKVLKQQWVPENVGDFSPYLTSLPAADGLAAWEPGGAGIKLFIQWFGLGLNKTMPIAAPFHGGFTDPFIPAALPPKVAAEVVGTPASQGYAPDSQTPENQAFQKAMTPVLGFPPADDGSSGPWQAALVFQAGVKAANGDTSPDPLLAGILGSTTVGPEGTTSFAGSNIATRTYYIVEGHGGAGPRQDVHLQDRQDLRERPA